MARHSRLPAKKLRRLESGALKPALEETQVNVKARVKRIFYELLLAETLADLASRLLNTVTDLEGAVKRRVESGEAPPFELVKVNVESLQGQKQVSQTKGKGSNDQSRP